MTAQIPDTFVFEGAEFSLVSPADGLFRPTEYGLFPEPLHTGCFRGYLCRYEVVMPRLELLRLVIRTHGGVYPAVGGAVPALDAVSGSAVYDDLHLPIKYQGNVRIARGFLSQYRAHFGPPGEMMYREVMALAFFDGMVVECEDVSREAERLRQAYEIHRKAKS